MTRSPIPDAPSPMTPSVERRIPPRLLRRSHHLIYGASKSSIRARSRPVFGRMRLRTPKFNVAALSLFTSAQRSLQPTSPASRRSTVSYVVPTLICNAPYAVSAPTNHAPNSRDQRLPRFDLSSIISPPSTLKPASMPSTTTGVVQPATNSHTMSMTAGRSPSTTDKPKSG